MTEPSSETPIGQSPPGGGPRRKWGSEAERVAAYRRRQREAKAQTSPADAGDAPDQIPPERSQTALAITLDRITAEVRRLRDEGAAITSQVESVIAGLTDPDAVASTLDAVAANAREEVAVAEARATDADRLRRQAEHTADEARRAAAEATEAAEALDARLAEVETEAQNLRDIWEAERAGRANDAEAAAGALDKVRAEHADELRAINEAHQAAIEQHEARAAALRDEATVAADAAAQKIEGLSHKLVSEAAARGRAEETVTALRADLERVRQELANLRDDIPHAIERHREDLRAALEERHAAELEAATARRSGDVARLEGQLEACENRRASLAETIELLRTRLAEQEGA